MKKALDLFDLFEKLAYNTQLIFTCSKTETEKLEEVVKYVKSLYC